MELLDQDCYQLNLDLEWENFLYKNKHKIDSDSKKIIYNNYNACYKQLNYYPVYTDASILWLYRNNAPFGGNTVDLIKLGLSEPITVNHLNFSSNAYIQLICSTRSDYIHMYKKVPIIIPFLKQIIHWGYTIIEMERGSVTSEYLLFKNEVDVINFWRVKFNPKLQVVLSNLFSIPKDVIQSIIEVTTRCTEKETEFVNYYGVLDKIELLWKECNIPQDPLKTIKTVYFEKFGILDAYKIWLQENNLDDNLKNAHNYAELMQKKIQTEQNELTCLKKGVH